MIELFYQYNWFLLMVFLSTVWLWVTSIRPELQLNKTSHSNESTTPYQNWRVYIFIYVLHEFWKLGSDIWFLVCSAWRRVKWPHNISELFWLGLSLCQTSVQDLCLLSTRSSNRRCWKALMPLQVKFFLGCPFLSSTVHLSIYNCTRPFNLSYPSSLPFLGCAL